LKKDGNLYLSMRIRLYTTMYATQLAVVSGILSNAKNVLHIN